jgi:phospholipid/cholesterol/gamma-HCH transport system permease protein
MKDHISQQSDMTVRNVNVQTAKDETGRLVLGLSGWLDSTTTGSVWKEAVRAIGKFKAPRVMIEASKLDYCDGAGIGLLFELRRIQEGQGGTFEVHGLDEKFHRLLTQFDPKEFAVSSKPALQDMSLPVEVGTAAVKIFNDIYALISYIGELFTALVYAFIRPGQVRWKDVFRVAESAGVNALPIVALISFLVGLIMAFQAAIPMRQFGAEIYVADLVALTMLRELSPLMTAIIMAGRTGSSFAAEIGTMKVNEEIAALCTMGLEPVRFLVVTRVLATFAMTPLLTVFSGLLALLGGSIVLLSMGYPFITYYNQVVASVSYIDLWGGLVKALVFGITIAAIGTLRGLQTKTGASAVGESTTSAVVSGIILIILIDGVFSVVFYFLGI